MNKRMFSAISALIPLFISLGITCGQTIERKSNGPLLGASPSFTSSSTEDLLDRLAKIEARRIASERFIRRGTLLSVIVGVTSCTAYYMYKYHYHTDNSQTSSDTSDADFKEKV